MHFFWRFTSIVILFFTLISASTVSASDHRDPKRILVIVGNSKNQRAVQLTEKGIQEVFKFKANHNYHIEQYIEYLDLNLFSDKQYKHQLVSFLSHKYADSSIDLIISVIPSSLDFLIEYGDGIFPNIPIVFSVVSELNLKTMKLSPNITGISYKPDIKGTLDTILKLQPTTKHIVVVGGVSDAITKFIKGAKSIFNQYDAKLKFTYLTNHSMPEILEQVAHLHEHTSILYTWMYKDKEGNSFNPREAIVRIANAANVPSYSLWETYLGQGIVGGNLIGFTVQGRKAAEISLRILNGEKPDTFPVISFGAIVKMFDWRQLKRWGINENQLPPGSIVHYKELSLGDRYKWQIIAVISFCLIEFLLILALLMQMTKRHRAEHALTKSHNKLEKKVQERTYELGERIKELNCMYGLSKLIEKPKISLAQVLQGTADLIPSSWQYPEITCARIRQAGREYLTENFHETTWNQAQDIIVHGESIGTIEVFYFHKKIEIDEGPFLAEERSLLNALAERLGRVIEQIQTEKTLHKSEEKYRNLVETMNEGLIELDQYFRVSFVNQKYCRILGLTRELLIDRDIRDISAQYLVNDGPAVVEKQIGLRKKGHDTPYEVQFLRPDGKKIWLRNSPHPTFDADGNLHKNVVVVTDITNEILAEQQLKESLTEKEVLLRELYHRTKNNMQVVMSMVSLQTQNIEDENILRMFKETNNRINTMALVHEKLYQTKNLSRIDLKDYFTDLINLLESSYQDMSEGIRIKTDMSPAMVTIDAAIPCGLIMNELLSNVFKHAFPGNRQGEIKIHLKKKDDRIDLKFKDNGVGLPEGFDYREAESMGFQTIVALVEHQLGGTINLINNKGTEYQIYFNEQLHPKRV